VRWAVRQRSLAERRRLAAPPIAIRRSSPELLIDCERTGRSGRYWSECCGELPRSPAKGSTRPDSASPCDLTWVPVVRMT
jgi:hypothetical protein